MQPSEYLIVGTFRNDTASEMNIHLEMVPERVVLAPGHSVEILAKPSRDLLPLTIDIVEGGLQIHANRVFDPDWHVRFNGKLLKPGTPTRLSEFE